MSYMDDSGAIIARKAKTFTAVVIVVSTTAMFALGVWVGFLLGGWVQ